MSLKSLLNQTITNKSLSVGVVGGTGGGVRAPVITSITICDSSYNNIDDTSLDPAGSYVKLNGTGFQSGCSVYFNNATVTATFVSSTEVRIQTPATTVGSYNLMLFNPDNQGGAIYLNLSVSNFPSWTTSAGSLGSVYEQTAYANTVVATGDTPLTYSLYSGTLPSGITLSSGGVLSGTTPAEAGSTTYTFVANVKDNQGQDSTRTFTLTINVDVVTWSSPAQNYVITSYEYSPISNVSLSATAGSGYGVLYSPNATPSGISTNTQSGLISGTINTTGNSYVRYTATANTTGRSATRDVVFNTIQDVVTWSSPAEATAYSVAGGSAMANVTLSATSAAGRTITYTANALPSGVSLSGNTIYGTPDTAQTVNTLLTATAATTNRSATRNISWTITLGDTYWKYTTLLLNGSTPTTTFINDASLNNNALTIAGDTKPNLFNPYRNGYYSNYFPGTYATLPSSSQFTMGTGDFTIEMWYYPTAALADNGIFSTTSTGGTIGIFLTDSNAYIGSSSVYESFSWGTTVNRWQHLAISRNSGTTKFYLNGTLKGTTSTVYNMQGTGLIINSEYVNNQTWCSTGYLSNLRVIKGTGLYSSAFTPPTNPLTAVANTVLLTCQSNRLVDNSINNFTITNSGAFTVSSSYPFTTPTTSAYNTMYSTYFDAGTGDYLTIANATNLQPGTGDFTYEFWFYQTNSTGTQEIVSKGAGLQIYTSGTTLYAALSASNNGTYFMNATVGTLTTGAWNHIAFVRSGNNYYGYLNGTRTLLATSASSPDTGTDPLFIGSYTGPAYHTYGIVSNFRFVKGTAVYTDATITVPTSSLTAISGTQLLTCQDNTFKDNSSNGYTINSFVKAKPIAVSPFTMTTSTNTVTSLGSAYFDGTGDYLTCGNINFASNPFTIEGWFYPTTLDVGRNFWGMDNGSATNPKILMYVDSSSRLTVDFGNAGTTQFPVAASLSTYGLTVNQWHHIAIVRTDLTSTGFKLYINGINAGTGQVGTNLNTITANFNIGYIGEAYGNPFVGYINDFRITNGTALYTSNFLPPQAPLTPVTNTSLLTCQYNGGATNNGFVDQSSFNNIITRAGNVTQGTFSPFSQNGWSNYFDGTGDYLSVASNALLAPGTSDFTYESWIYPLSLAQTTSSASTFFYVGSGGLQIGMTSTTQGNAWGVAQSGLAWILYNTTIPTLNNWNHVAVTRSSGTLRLFLNGVLLTSTTNSTNFATGGLNIGYGAVSGDEFNGYMSNVRFIKGNALYTGNFTPSTTPLTSVANTQLLTCQSNRLIDNSPNNFTITKNGDTSVQAYSPFGGVTSVPTSYSNYFDGTGDYLATSANSAWTFGTGDFTMEAWVNPSVTASGQNSIISEIGSGGNTGLELTLYSSPANSVRVATWASYVLTGSTSIPIGSWTHLAVTRQSNTIKLWINGVLETSTTFSTDLSAVNPLQIGWNGANQYFNGYISNVRIVKGTALYTSTFTPSTSPLTTTSQGATASQVSLLTCQNNTMVDNSPNYFALTANGDVKPKPFNPFGLTNTASVSYTPAVNGGSMYFDGSGDYLTTSATQILPASTTFTVEAWIYPTTSYANYRTIVSQGTAGNAARFDFYLDITTGILRAQLGTVASPNTSTSIPLNAWTHVAFSTSAGSYKIFVNGVVVLSGTAAFTPQNSVLTVGAFAASDTEQFIGYISDVRVTGVALYTSNFYPGPAPATPKTTIGATTYSSNLLLNGTSGGIIDYHSSNDLETVGNTQLAPQDPYGGSYYSNYFDGTGDYLSVAANSAWAFGTGDFTVEAWIKPNAAASGQNSIISWLANDGNTSLDLQYYNSPANTIRVGTYNSYPLAGAIAITPGTWNHIALTRESGTMKIWVNGVLDASTTYTTNLSAVNSLQVGYNGYNQYFNGYISNVRLVKGTALYTSAFTPSTTPLTAVSGTSVLTCQSNKFVDNSTNAFTITRNGDTSVQSQNPFQQNTGKSLYFDGTGDYLYFPSSNAFDFGTGDFTIEFWVNFSALSTNRMVVDRWATGNANSWQIYWRATGTSMAFYEGSTIVLQDPSTTNIITGQWTHVAVSRSNGVSKMFINGSVVASAAHTTSLSNTLPLAIGRQYSTSTNEFSGYIKDLRITKGVARYTTTFTPPTTALQVK